MCDTICDMNHHFVWNLGHGCGHHVDGAYGTDDAAPLESTLAVLDTGGAEIRNDREVLPDLIGQAVLIDFLTEDRVGRLISATFIATPPYSDAIIHSSFHYNIWLYGKIINFHIAGRCTGRSDSRRKRHACLYPFGYTGSDPIKFQAK